METNFFVKSHGLGNCYIVIEANAIHDDVKELFKESDLIILN